jgi:hypothetical protein
MCLLRRVAQNDFHWFRLRGLAEHRTHVHTRTHARMHACTHARTPVQDVELAGRHGRNGFKDTLHWYEVAACVKKDPPVVGFRAQGYSL